MHGVGAPIQHPVQALNAVAQVLEQVKGQTVFNFIFEKGAQR